MKTTKTKHQGFTRLWGVRFTEEESRMIEREAAARSLKPGTYIRMATMETVKSHQQIREA